MYKFRNNTECQIGTCRPKYLPSHYMKIWKIWQFPSQWESLLVRIVKPPTKGKFYLTNKKSVQVT